MNSEPRKIVLASLLVSAVAIAAYVSQSDERWLSTDELGLERDSASPFHTRDDTVTGWVTTGQVRASGNSAHPTAAAPQVARNGLQRNDVTSAQAPLDAAQSVDQDVEQGGALQTPLQTHADKPQQASKSTLSASTSTVKNSRSHEHHVAARKSWHHGSGYARHRHAPEAVIADKSTSGGSATVVSAPVVESVPDSSLPTTTKGLTGVNSGPVAPPSAEIAPSNPQAGVSVQVVPTPPLVEPASSGGVALKSDSGATTRSQVRAALARARSDGSLPPFGNPDPAGPGGAPSERTAPRP